MTLSTAKLYTTRYHDLMREFPLRELRTKKDAQLATAILDRIFREKYHDEGEEAYAMLLARLLGDYEDKREPVHDTASGRGVLKYLAEENGMTQGELADLLGVGQSLVSMILSGARPITIEHAKRLGSRFHIDPAVFLDLK